MAERRDLDDWLVDALRSLGGRARPIEVARFIWRQHQTQLRASGDLFYTWQRELQSSAARLRRRKLLRSPRRGYWEIDREMLLACSSRREPTPPRLALVVSEDESQVDETIPDGASSIA